MKKSEDKFVIYVVTITAAIFWILTTILLVSVFCFGAEANWFPEELDLLIILVYPFLTIVGLAFIIYGIFSAIVTFLDRLCKKYLK